MPDDIRSHDVSYNISLHGSRRILAAQCKAPISRGTMNQHKNSLRPLALSNWLLAVASLVFVMVVVGGITRLTESGLSITVWDPIKGAIPPLSDAQWQRAFDLYKATPEYVRINGPAGMDLAQFKFIFFWEWVHRFLGRLVGIAFAVPFAWFAMKKAIPRDFGWRLGALLALGASQGALGWYMVQSGLVNRTDVSHFRLSAHLLTALFILAGLIWTALDLRQQARKPGSHLSRLTILGVATALALTLQLLLGAWVAGLDAGYLSNTWPLMNERLVPDGIVGDKSTLFTLTHDPYLLHFLHRWWAWGVVAVVIATARKIRAINRKASIAIHSALGVQVLLGIATVMSGMNVVLAVLHQAVGALLVVTTAWGVHVLGRRL